MPYFISGTGATVISRGTEQDKLDAFTNAGVQETTGMMRYNTTNDRIELFTENSGWNNLALEAKDVGAGLIMQGRFSGDSRSKQEFRGERNTGSYLTKVRTIADNVSIPVNQTMHLYIVCFNPDTNATYTSDVLISHDAKASDDIKIVYNETAVLKTSDMFIDLNVVSHAIQEDYVIDLELSSNLYGNDDSSRNINCRVYGLLYDADDDLYSYDSRTMTNASTYYRVLEYPLAQSNSLKLVAEFTNNEDDQNVAVDSYEINAIHNYMDANSTELNHLSIGKNEIDYYFSTEASGISFTNLVMHASSNLPMTECRIRNIAN
ncbi:TPA: hypothetical protein RQK38_000511 [Vibrio vulnificus]|nr:hypothetical protein [Vibrio vulnificus]